MQASHVLFHEAAAVNYVNGKHCITLYGSKRRIRHFYVRSQNFEKATISSIMSLRPSAWKNSAPTERISMKFDI
jgi:hypothetical protein